MEFFSLSVHTTYQDLVQTLAQASTSELLGSPQKKTVGPASYWYMRQRIGTKTVDRYVGPDTQEVRARIEEAKAKASTLRDTHKRTGLLCAQLRAAGVPTLDRGTGKVLSAMAKVGTFRLGGTLVGTHAFRLYSAELGVRLDALLAATEDVDIAAFERLTMVIEERVGEDLERAFRDLGLEPMPGLAHKQRPTRWTMRGGGTSVDFLVPKMRHDAEVLKLEALGVYAQALSFLNYLIADPISAVAIYRSGVLVQIPRPERYAIHKLIVAQRREGSAKAKAKKDLDQAEALIQVLAEDRPAELEEAFETAMAKGQKWQRAIKRSLRQRPEIARRLESL